jgi:hypothetical protein
MTRVVSFGRYLGVAARGRQGEDCMFRVVERVNDEVSGARMIGILPIKIERNCAGERLAPEPLVAGAHCTKQ